MKVLLYSTGLDSELHRLLEQPDVLLFFKSGARYEAQELLQLQEFLDKGVITEDVKIDDTLNFGSLERSNSIVPMRNIFYMLRALEYGDDVLLGVTSHDLHYDKMSDTIGALHSFVQSYYYFREIPETWGSEWFNLRTPYRHLSKGELLRLAIEEGHDVSHIPTLRTCYSGTSEKGCGQCASCMGKAVALAVNNMFSPDLFDNDPRLLVDEYIKRGEEDKDSLDWDLFIEEYETLRRC